MTKNVLLIGGGMDSVTLALDLFSKDIEFEMLHVNYGQIAARAELETITKLSEYLNVKLHTTYNSNIQDLNVLPNKIIDGPKYDNAYILGRNYYLLGEAAQYGDAVYIGLSEGRIFDCTEEFIANMNLAWKGAFDGKKKILAPFVNTAKKDLVKLGHSICSQYFDFVTTCWVPSTIEPIRGDAIHIPCGVCTHCKELKAYSEGLL